MLYAAVACLYVLGCVSIFPRTGPHDAILAAALPLTLLAGAGWQSAKLIPWIGAVIYYLPWLSLVAIPFVLDFYLMSRH